MERITGPAGGFWIVCSARRNSGSSLFTAYAKVCLERPGSYWDAHCLFKLFGGEHHRSPEAALATAEAMARFQVAGLASSRQRAMCRRRVAVQV
ncbi:hypothetical protein [Ramlibacter tataouinensis]|uniref:Uncharacterized protein n=1 Tax=Ramlibacter tataouinensis (strain ATCC BAA-407 / DSM 14655 / LMG 21543 / TTB310) TaxID=365046 RepID=F5XX73_RAMTT|nr:hypothetical protein [Ramlibacter tataouinensis]AEG93017.1 hypothetical protein Rta_19260 [Ramlibacter tataouinensis TTB310]